MGDMSGGVPLGVAEVEVRANLDKLHQGFADAKRETTQFLQPMVTVNKAVKDFQRTQEEAAASTERLRTRQLATAEAINRVTRATNPAIANQRLVAAAVREAESAYMKGEISARALQRAQMIGAPWLEKTRVGMRNTAAASNLMGSSFLSTARSARFLIAAIGFGFVGKAIQLVKATVDATAAINDQAQAVGLTSREFQEYRGIAKDVGMTTEDMDSAFKTLASNIDDARLGKVGPFSKLIAKLGVDIKDAGGKVRPTSAIFDELIDKLGRVGDEAQRRGAQAIAFGEAGATMGKLVEQGSEGIDTLRKAVEDTGMVLSDEQIQKADETAKKLEQVKEVLRAKIATAVVENAEAISTLADAFAYLATKAIEGTSAYIKGIENIKRNGFPIGFGLLGHIGGSGEPDPNAPGRTITVKLPAATPAPKPKGPNISLAGLLSPKGARGRRPVENQFEREELREREAHLRLLRDRTGNLHEQNDIDRQLIDIDLQQRIEQLRQLVDRKALTKGQAKKIEGEARENADLQKEAADRKMREGLIEQSYRNAQEALQLEQAGLEIDLELARTDEQRKRVELAILDSKQQQARAEIEKEIELAKEAKDEQRIGALTEELATLRANQLKEVKAFGISHLTGLAKFKNDLPQTVDEINEQIEKIRFDLFTERLQRAAQMAEDVGDAFGRAAGALARFENPLDVLKGLISDLAQTFTQNVIEKPIADWATRVIGMPAAKQAFGKGLTGPDAMTVQEMNVALGIATQDLHALALAASRASAALGYQGTNAGAAGAAEALSGSATDASQALNTNVPAVNQFGGALMQIIGSLSGGGGGGGGILGSLLNIGLAAFGAVGGGGGLGGPDLAGMSKMLGAAPVGVNYIPGGLPGLGFAEGGSGVIGGRPGRDRNVLGLDSGAGFKPFLRVSKGERLSVDSIASSRLGDLGPMMLMRLLGERSSRPLHVNFGDIVVPGARDDRSARSSARQVLGHVQRGLGEVVRRGLNR